MAESLFFGVFFFRGRRALRNDRVGQGAGLAAPNNFSGCAHQMPFSVKIEKWRAYLAGGVLGTIVSLQFDAHNHSVHT